MNEILTQLLQALNDWIDENGLPESFRISKERIQFTLQTATDQKNKYYFGYGDDASPFKRVACICYAIARERPVCLDVSSGPPSDETPSLLKYNADFAIDFACYMLSVSSFDCAPEVKPPFVVKMPSTHFRKEFVKALAWNNLSTPAIALLLELLMYQCSNGKSLRGKLDD